MNEVKTPRMMLSNGAVFPFYLSTSLAGHSKSFSDSITKQRIVEMIRNNKEMYLSDISEVLEISMRDAIELVAELKMQGKIKTD